MTRDGPPLSRLVLPAACLTLLIALAVFVARNRDAQALAEAFVMLDRLRGKYGFGAADLAASAARLLLTAAYPAVVLLASVRAGGALAAWTGLRLRTGCGAVVIRAGLGLGLVALGTLALALTGTLAGRVPAGLACAMIAAGGGIRGGARRIRRDPVPASLLVLGVLGSLLLGWDLAGAFGPEWFEDGRTYHLGLPDRFLLTGKMPVIQGHLLGFLPLNGEMAYAAVMGLVGELPGVGTVREEAARLLNWALGGLAAVAVGVLAARLARGAPGGSDDRVAAVVAMWLFISMPVTMIENEICFTDNFRVLLETAGLLLVLRRGNAGVCAGAACAGFAMGGKYLSVVGAALMAAALAGTGGRWRGVRRAAWFVGVASAVLAPWLSRNWLASADPVYPFLPELFSPLGFDRPMLDRWMEDNRHYGVTGMTWAGWASLPFRCSLEPGDQDFGTFTTGPVLLGLVPLLAGGAWTAAAGWVAVVAGGQAIVWSLTSHLIRYLLPALAILCALLGWRVALVHARTPGYGRVLIGLLAVWVLPAGVLRVHHRINLDDQFQTLGAVVGRGESSGEAMHAGRGFGPAARTLGAGAVLLVGEDRVLGLGRRWIAASRYDLQPVKRWAQESPDARRFALKTRQAGVGAVILNGGQFRAWLGRGPAFDLTDRELGLINPWWKRLRVIWRRPPWEGSVPAPRPPRSG